MTIEDKKKLAAAVAKRLGEDWTSGRRAGVRAKDYYFIVDILGTEYELYDWRLAGACIDRAKECGWELSVHRGDVLFRQIGYVGSWGFHSVEHDGYALAILRAFADIPLEHFEVQS